MVIGCAQRLENRGRHHREFHLQTKESIRWTALAAHDLRMAARIRSQFNVFPCFRISSAMSMIG